MKILFTVLAGHSQNEFQDNWLPKIRTINPSISAVEATELVNAELSGDKSGSQRLDALLADIEVFYGFRPPPNLLSRAPLLKWIQSPLAGVDHFLIPEIKNSPVLLTNSKIHATQVSEAAFNLMLMLARQAPFFMANKALKKWQPYTPEILNAKTVGVLGLGAIGQEFARMCKAFGMKVIGTKATLDPSIQNVDRLLPPEGLNEVLTFSDFVAVFLPLTVSTDKLIGTEQINKMKPSAYLINVGRGGIIDEEALVTALTENRIAGAGLDVFGKEPLPIWSKLWDLPNVIITPHVSGRRSDYDPISYGLFYENIRRYLEEQSLLNIIDKQKGY